MLAMVGTENEFVRRWLEPAARNTESGDKSAGFLPVS